MEPTVPAREPLPVAIVPVARRRRLGLELILVVLVATAVLLPGIWRYSLIDPWESHYGEVARRMLQDHDWVHTDWQNEGFRSKPVLTFWLMATSMRALGHGADGGYSGEMTSSPTIMLAIRLPFVFLADTVYVMSKSPGRFVVKREIDLPRPRDLEITYTREFTDIVHELRGHIGAGRKTDAQAQATTATGLAA